MSGHTGNRGSVPPGMQRAKIQCRNGCDHNNSSRVIVWPLGRPQPKIYCRSCQTRGGFRGDASAREETVNFQERILNWRGEKVTVYLPGDRGFAKRAAECTHVSKITNVAGKNNQQEMRAR
jgi:hypothetical protein